MSESALVLTSPFPLDQHPAAVYLASLGSATGRRTTQGALDTIAHLFAGEDQDALNLAWSQVRHQHAAAIRAPLATTYRPATVNKALTASRGVLRQARLLGQMTAACGARRSPGGGSRHRHGGQDGRPCQHGAH